MRHRKHRHQLGVKKEHREALVATLAASLFRHGKIRTTLAKAKALRPFSERIITLAKKAEAASDPARSLHYRRLAIARVRDKDAVKELFDDRAGEFKERNGGYTRIYKLIPRLGDAADMAIIELVSGADEGYGKGRRKQRPAKKAAAASAGKAAESPAGEAEDAGAGGDVKTETAKPQAAEADKVEAPAKEAAAEKDSPKDGDSGKS